jgi:hypothetical protein
MKRSKLAEEQMVYALRQAEAGTPIGPESMKRRMAGGQSKHETAGMRHL